MKAVILAAGKGNRMLPLTINRPKAMLPLANKPILEQLLLQIREAGISDLIFVVNSDDVQIHNYFGNGKRWRVNIIYSAQEKSLGTADAVRTIETQVKDNFLLINADNIVLSRDIAKIASNKEMTVGFIETKDTKGLGVLAVKQEKIISIKEKAGTQPSSSANAGVYLFTPEIFAAIRRTPISPRGEYEITDTLQLLIDKKHTILAQKIDSWLNLSYPWDLLEANEFFLSELQPANMGEIEPNTVLKPPVSIDSGTIIRSGAYITGPVVIGKNCDIGPNCFIRPFTAIGDNCRIGASVEVKNSIIMQGTKIPHLSYVGDSIIGEECNFGAGTQIANLRFDNREILINGQNSGRQKLGAIIGDKVKTGINVSINAGSVISPNTHIAPGTTVSGNVSSG